MLLKEIYSDVMSRVNAIKQEHNLFYYDFVNAINDAIVLKRNEYVAAGNGSQIATREALYFTTPDYYYPYVRSVELSSSILKDFPVSKAVISAVAYRHADIANVVKTYAAGQNLKKGLVLYKNDQLITALNSYTLTYNPKNVRNYKLGNELVYAAGDIIKDIETDYIYSVIAGFTADGTEDAPASNANLTRLYWRETGPSHIMPAFKPFDQIDELVLYSDMSRACAFTIKGTTVYVSDNITFMTIDFVPEWTKVVDLDAEVDIPMSMATAVKLTAFDILRTKLAGAANE